MVQRGYHPVSLAISMPNCHAWPPTLQPTALHPAAHVIQSQAVATAQSMGWVNSNSAMLLHSPLLKQSLLFSSPPPTDMLKLGGSSHPLPGPRTTFGITLSLLFASISLQRHVLDQVQSMKPCIGNTTWVSLGCHTTACTSHKDGL